MWKTRFDNNSKTFFFVFRVTTHGYLLYFDQIRVTEFVFYIKFNKINYTMDACEAVEEELQRVITKFSGVHEHARRMLGDVTKNFEDLRSSIIQGV